MPRDPTQLMTADWTVNLYHALRKWLPFIALGTFPTSFFVDAPFGRFAPFVSNASAGLFSMATFQLDGIRAWIFMELISPFTFIYAFLISPLTFYTPGLPALTSPQTLMTLLFLVHYTNRALIHPLRTPSRSKNHLSVVLAAVAFNLANGYLQGSYLSSPIARIYLGGSYVYDRPSFWIGIILFFGGFIGNIVHDEILLNIRREAKAKKERAGEEEEPTAQAKGAKKAEPKGEYYGIPHGYLYKYISFPNYFCEWVEWLGFALAASPPPFEPSFASPADFVSSISSLVVPFFSPAYWVQLINTPSRFFAPTLSPPWIFFFAEVLMMLPRAYRSHLWYKQRFGDSYPKDRKAVIPFLV